MREKIFKLFFQELNKAKKETKREVEKLKREIETFKKESSVDNFEKAFFRTLDKYKQYLPLWVVKSSRYKYYFLAYNIGMISGKGSFLYSNPRQLYRATLFKDLKPEDAPVNLVEILKPKQDLMKTILERMDEIVSSGKGFSYKLICPNKYFVFQYQSSHSFSVDNGSSQTVIEIIEAESFEEAEKKLREGIIVSCGNSFSYFKVYFDNCWHNLKFGQNGAFHFLVCISRIHKDRFFLA